MKEILQKSYLKYIVLMLAFNGLIISSTYSQIKIELIKGASGNPEISKIIHSTGTFNFSVAEEKKAGEELLKNFPFEKESITIVTSAIKDLDLVIKLSIQIKDGNPVIIPGEASSSVFKLSEQDNSIIEKINCENLVLHNKDIENTFARAKVTVSNLNNIKQITYSLESKDSPPKSLFSLPIGEGRTAEDAACKANDGPPAIITKEQYYNVIKQEFPGFKPFQISKEDNTVLVFFDAEMKLIEGVVMPVCNTPQSSYKFFVIGEDDPENPRKHELKVDTEEFVSGDFNVNAGGVAIAAGDNLKVLCEATVGPVSAGAKMRIEHHVDDKLVQSKNFTIPSCNDGYHVSIMAGFYRSELSLPNNIRTATVNGVNTLIADNPDNQLAVVLSAVFYPKPRPFFYEYKSLDFWNKWSFSLGTKFSQNLFDDAFLGLNYEFAKGATFTTGMHYGQHTVINGYNNFKFGSTPFTSSSSTGGTQFNAASDVHQRWDIAWFFGVNIDLRVLSAFRGANDNNNFRRSQPAPANPGTPPANPGTPPANPGTPPANPGTPPANPGTPPANPGTPPS